MTIKVGVHYIAVCDVCFREFDDSGEYLGWSDTPALALDWVEGDDEWVSKSDETVICPTSDPAHNSARGAEGEFTVHAGNDEMTIRFAAGDAPGDQP
jgi:hypothetical protein